MAWGSIPRTSSDPGGVKSLVEAGRCSSPGGTERRGRRMHQVHPSRPMVSGRGRDQAGRLLGGRVLGPARAVVWRPRRRGPRRGAGTRGPRSQPDRSNVYRGPLGRLAVSGPPPCGIRQPSRGPGGRRWVGVVWSLHHRRRSLCATGQPPHIRRTRLVSPLPGARARRLCRCGGHRHPGGIFVRAGSATPRSPRGARPTSSAEIRPRGGSRRR